MYLVYPASVDIGFGFSPGTRPDAALGPMAWPHVVLRVVTCHAVTNMLEAAEYGCNVPALEETCQVTFHETIGANVRGEQLPMSVLRKQDVLDRYFLR